MKRLLVGLVALLAFGLVFALVPGCAKPAPAPQEVLPKKMVWTGGNVGTSGYSLTVMLANAMHKVTGMTVRVLPTGTGVSAVMALSAGAVDLAFSSYDAFCAVRAIEEFASIEWGPQKLVALLFPPWAVGPTTQADSGIKKVADLKGKRTAFVPGLASVNEKTRAILAFAGYTMDDAIIVTYPSSAAAYQALLDGKIDWFSTSGPTAPKIYELAASPHGVYWIPLPSNDKEGWKRLQAVMPLVPTLITRGAGIKPGEAIEAAGSHTFMPLTYEGRLSDEVAYAFVKVLDEAYEEHIKGAVEGSEAFNFKGALDPPYDVPLHPGVIRYAKDKGLWTDEREAANKAVRDLMAKAQKDWDIVLGEVTEKGLPAQEFPKYWLKRRAELVGK